MIMMTFLATSCSGKEGGVPEWPWEDSEPGKPEVEQPGTDAPTPDGWKDVTDDFGKLPDYIKVSDGTQRAVASAVMLK